MYYCLSIKEVLKLNGCLSIAFKITNWCNLNCLHCCENSGCGEPLNFMDLEKLERYVHESKEIQFNVYEGVVMTGGEALAPYLFGQPNYIPTALKHIQHAGYVPTIKTNGLWGKRADVRMNILKDMAKSAYASGKLVTLDISVDEFHNNMSPVANIIADSLSSNEITYGVRIVLVGFNTEKSFMALEKLKHELYARDLEIETLPEGDWGVYNAAGTGFRVFLGYDNSIFDLGRAKQNNVYNMIRLPKSKFAEHCLIMDSNDTVTLDYDYSEKIAGRKIKTVFESLVRNYGD